MQFSLIPCTADGKPVKPTKILQRLGFTLFGNARDPDAGDVWEWRT
jgi:hypothetical protein